MKKAQSLIEFIVVIPLLILVVFGIIEFSIFLRASQTVQQIAMEAAVASSNVYVDENSTPNLAVNEALNVVTKRVSALGLSNITFSEVNLPSSWGEKPFALYKFESDQTRNVDNVDLPLLTFTVDYRDPYTQGVNTQLIYQYRTLLVGIEFTLLNGRKVKIIPRDIEISSTKTQQYVNY